MNVRVALVVSVVAVGCGVEPSASDAPGEVATAQSELLGQQLAPLQRALVLSAMAECGADTLVVGPATNAPLRAARTLRPVHATQQGDWRVLGCGSATLVPRLSPNGPTPALLLLSELDGTIADARAALDVLVEVVWKARPNQGDRPQLEFSSAEGKAMDFTLGFDDYEGAAASARVTRLQLQEAARTIATLDLSDAHLTPAQRAVRNQRLEQLARLLGRTRALAVATRDLLHAGPGQYQRTQKVCQGLFSTWPCLELVWAPGQVPSPNQP